VSDISECGAILLAGGKGTRLGYDKPHVRLGSRTLLQRVIDAAENLSNEVVLVVGSDEDSLSSLEEQHPSITVIRDSRDQSNKITTYRIPTGYLLDNFGT
jgi:molybdopterin-guanine dinucleotide biosynthesis protein A